MHKLIFSLTLVRDGDSTQFPLIIISYHKSYTYMNEIGNPSSQVKADDSQCVFTNIVDRHPWVAKKEVTRAQHKSWLSGLKPVNLDLG